MSKLVPLVYKKSLIAIAVASLSACAVMPQSTDADDTNSIGDNIVKAGQSVADLGLSTWQKTTRFLGFRSADEGIEASNRSDDELLAQQNLDQATPATENGVILQPADNRDQPVIISQAEAPTAKLPLNNSAGKNNPQQLPGADAQTLELADAELSGSDSTESALDGTELVDTQNVDQDSENQSLFTLNQPLNSNTVRSEDLIHEVGDSQTLWEIAKLTTGNANNWHTLADINDLTQSATVFPGQELLIPSDMVKPGYGTAAPAAPAIEVAAETQRDINVIDSEAPDAQLNTVAELTDNTERAPEIAAALPEETALQTVSGDAAQSATIAENATPVDLNEGETLWDFAKRTTGDATNWKAIAAQNNFTEKQAVTVRPGQTIYVPQSLIKSDDISSAAIDKVQERVSEAALPALKDVNSLSSDTQLADVELEQTAENITLVTADTMQESTEVMALTTEAAAEEPVEEIALATEAKVEVPVEEIALAPEATVDAVEDSVDQIELATSDKNELQSSEIIKSAYKSTDAITPSQSAESEQLQVVAENESAPDAVMVIGTYYPKAVYNNADFSSSLLMRVSPGTRLQVSRLMGSWFEVETDKGMGYVHQRDIQ